MCCNIEDARLAQHRKLVSPKLALVRSGLRAKYLPVV